jgi:amidase
MRITGGAQVLSRAPPNTHNASAGRPMRSVPAFFLVCVLTACSSSTPPPSPAAHNESSTPTLDVVELSAVEARDRMAAGTITSRALTQAYLDRIRQIDDAGPMLNAVIEINATAIADAEALDAERKGGKVRGPLHGIPILIKDNIDIVGMANSAGSLALADNRPKQDAFIVTRLRDAGAVILGKTNLSEWANFRSTRSTSGSSSGTGAAIAASLAAIGVGTETDGSIICPASINGLVGLKPTVGLVSRRGIIPISATQDTAGPMARSVADAAMLLTALAAVDAGDPATESAKDRIPDDYAVLQRDAFKARRLGALRQATGYHPDVDRAFDAAVDVIKSLGGAVVDVKIPDYDAWNAPELEVMLYEFKDGLNQYLKASGSPHASLEALIAFNKTHADTVMPFFGQELFERAQAKGSLTDAAYLKAREDAMRLAGGHGLLAALERDDLDAIIAPSSQPAWLIDHVLGDHFVGAGYSMAAIARTPSISVPIGDSHGLPLGLTIMGRAYTERDVIAMAYSIEQAMHARKPPQFRAAVP